MTAQAKPSTKPKTVPEKTNRDRTRRVVTPEILQNIGTMALKGVPNTVIAKSVGIDESTVRHHLNTTIRPQWQEQSRSRLHEDLAKVALIERTAWERFEADAPAETVEQVEKGLRESKAGRVGLKIIKQATRSVKRPGQTAWIEVIQWCIEFRAKVFAHYAPTRTHVQMEGELRVAGKSPSEIDQEMMRRLAEQIFERRKHQAALKIGEN